MELVNKVAESGLIVIDLEDFFPREEVVAFDLKEYLFKDLLLKEMEFRESLKKNNWPEYQNKTVAVFCSTDAILPQWSYMLVTQYLLQQTAEVYRGTKEEVIAAKWLSNIQAIDTAKYKDERVIVKGCGHHQANSAAYVEISKKLIPVVKSLMFGEPCSTVPVYKRKGA